MTIDWASLRAQFPVAERCIYLNTGWSGPSSRATVAAMQARAERESFDGPTSPPVRNEKALLVGRIRQRVASLIGADSDEIALIYTTTEAMNTVVRGIGLQPGDEILTCNMEHNAVMVPAYLARARDGVAVNIVRFRFDEDAAQIPALLEAAMTPRTRFVLLSHVSWNRGTRLPMREVCAMAHARGAIVAIDAAQSAGHIDFNVRDLDCDVLALPGHKWLLGPDGAAFMYVRRDLIERLQPLAVVHGASRRYDFEGRFEYANDTIHKFELTTHSGPVLAGLEVSLGMFDDIGMPAVEQRSLELASRFIDGVAAIDRVRLTTPLDPSVRSGIVTFEVRDANPSEVCAALWQSDRIVGRVCNDRRIRVCFHVFNDESDVDRTVNAVARISERGIPPGTPTEAEYKEHLLEAFD
jgi:L-cysteine/cystine lyase